MRGVLAAAALALAGCAAPVPENFVQIPTGDWGSTSCSLRAIEGTVVADESWGIALKSHFSGRLVKIIWPLGWYGLREDDHTLLMNERGNEIARTGHYIGIIGTDFPPISPDESWVVCPEPGAIGGRLPPEFGPQTP